MSYLTRPALILCRSLHYNALTQDHKRIGLNDCELLDLELPSVMTEEMKQELATILLRTRAANDGKNFQINAMRLAEGHPQLAGMIAKVKAVNVPWPKKIDSENINYIRESDRELFKIMVDRFLDNSPQILHPQKHEYLISELSTFKGENFNADVMAGKMNLYFTSGNYGLILGDLYHKNALCRALILGYQNELKTIDSEGISELEPKHLSFMENSDYADAICKAYNSLRENNRLDLLKKNEEEIYDNPLLETVRKGFEKKKARWIVSFLKELARGDLVDVIRGHFNNRIRDLETVYEEMTYEARQTEIQYLNARKIASKDPSEFPRGCFDFIPDEWERQMLDKAFSIVERLNAWKLFDDAPEKLIGFYKWNNEVTKAMDEAGFDTGHAMIWGLSTMTKIRKYGWNTVVETNLNDLYESLGVFGKMEARYAQLENATKKRD